MRGMRGGAVARGRGTARSALRGLSAASLLVAAVLLGVWGAQAQDRVRFGVGDVPTVGMDLTVAPPAQTVPRGVQTVRGWFGGSGVRWFGHAELLSC